MKRLGKFLLASFIIAFSLRACVVETYQVTGQAMIPAAFPGDIILVSKLSYGLRVPGSGSHVLMWNKLKAGDLVVVKGVGNPPQTLLRRVVEVSGTSTLVVERGRIIISTPKANTVPCKDLKNSVYCMEELGGKKYHVRLPGEADPPIGMKSRASFDGRDDLLFVLADDRRNGPDSRQFHVISTSSVVGKVTHLVMPAKNLGNLKLGEETNALFRARSVLQRIL